MILHQRRMAGALSCTGHAVTCSGARLVDHKKKICPVCHCRRVVCAVLRHHGFSTTTKNITNEVELKQYNELVLTADTRYLPAQSRRCTCYRTSPLHVRLYVYPEVQERAFASRQNQSLQKDQEDETFLARSPCTRIYSVIRAGLATAQQLCHCLS